MVNEYGGLVTSLDEICAEIIKVPEKIKDLNLLQLGYVRDNVEELINNNFDDVFLKKQGIDKDDSLYRGYIAYKLIFLDVIEEDYSIIEYKNMLSNKDYVDVIKRIIDIYEYDYMIDDDFESLILDVKKNRYRDEPKLRFNLHDDVEDFFNLDIKKDMNEIEGYVNLLMLFSSKYGFILKYIDSKELNKDIYIEMVKLAVQSEGCSLEFVDCSIIDDTTYLEIVKFAVQENGYALELVDTSRFDNETYLEIVKLAVVRIFFAISYVDLSKMDNSTYIEIIKLGIEQNGMAIECIDKSVIDKKTYTELAKLAIQQNSRAIEGIDKSKIDKETYIELAKLAVFKDPQNLYFIKTDYLTYMDLALIALRQDIGIVNYDWFKHLYTSFEINYFLEVLREENKRLDLDEAKDGMKK